MGSLLDLSRPDAMPPRPADQRLGELGVAAWEIALAESADHSRAAIARAWAATESGKGLLAAIFGNSPFLSKLAVAEWPLLLRLVEDGPDTVFDAIAASVEQYADPGENQPVLMRRLRVAKRQAALVAGVAEIAGSWRLERQMAALSRLAEAALGAAVRHLLHAAAGRGSIKLVNPEDPEHDSGLIVLGMGKLGGGELNYSSDIDLILLFDSTRNPVLAPTEAQAFFGRLARDLVRILDERTGDGSITRASDRIGSAPH
jgi:glutamate-ammonia-ligase adenylyltransferase